MYDRINSIIRRLAVALTSNSANVASLDSSTNDLSLENIAGALQVQRSTGRNFGLLTQEGVIPAARMAFSANPTNGNVFQIGTATFQFVTNLAAATTYTQIKILGSAALTLAATLDAINGVTNANVVQGTTFATQFADATKYIVADAVTATVLRIRKAATQGGAAVPGTVASLALTCTITAGASAWSAANLNVSGKLATDALATHGAVTITAAMVTNASFQVELPFTPTVVFAFVKSSTGVQRASTDAVTISGNAINIALGGGASPAIQANDVVTFFAVA